MNRHRGYAILGGPFPLGELVDQKTFESIEIGPCKLYHGNCLEVLPTLPAESIDSIVTDPPYGLNFMGKDWDHGIPGVHFWTEVLRVAKPGAYLLAFGGTRTFHRLMVAIEDAGWEIRDTLMWVYGSGFPKSKNVALGIDKGEGFPNRGHRVSMASRFHPDGTFEPNGEHLPAYEAKTDKGKPWQGWGTALKPAWEPIILARKPLCGTVAENVLAHGTGGLNIDGCRIGTEQTTTHRNGDSGGNGAYGRDERVFDRLNPPGRWPANLIHDGSEEVVELFPGDEGTSAARFFYCAKASKQDRNDGCENLDALPGGAEYRPNDDGTKGIQSRLHGASAKGQNNHPTVKPTALMRYLCRLVTPPGCLILDPFAGSFSTGKAAVYEGFRCIGIEMQDSYLDIACLRIEAAIKEK